MKTKTAEEIAFDLASAAIDMMTIHSPHTEQMMRDAIQRWKAWQLDRKARKEQDERLWPDLCPHCGKRHRASYYDREPCNECCNKWSESLKDANGMCRSAMAIAERNGEANWPAFRDRLRESLERQHAVMYPSKRDADETADEKPDGQAENADGDGRREPAPPRQ